MIYLVLFASLAVGFYAATSTGVQVVGNEHRASRAMLASESGMQFIRFELASLNIPHDTQPDDLFATVFQQLRSHLEATGNLGSQTISLAGDTINIPSAADQSIPLPDGSRFRCTIAQAGQLLRVKVVGWADAPDLRRAIQMDYAVARRASAIFNYGVASRSPITMNGNVSILGRVDPAQGSVLSTASVAAPLTMIGTAQISGDVSFTNPAAWPSVSGSSKIAGSSDPAVWAQHVHSGVTEPDFPTIDVSAFWPYVLKADGTPNYYAPSMGKNLVNVVLPPGSYSFSGGATVKGILFIQTPCDIKFNGNCTIQGAIVVQNQPTGSVASNVLDFRGTVAYSGVETLPPSAQFPAGLRALTGSAILAPNFTLKFGGNFGTIGGSIIASKVEFSGNAGGTVRGTLINLDNTSLTLSGNSDIYIESQGTTQYPAGVFFGSNYVPLPDTYQEVMP